MALSEASRDLILLEETLSYLAESLQVPECPHEVKMIEFDYELERN